MPRSITILTAFLFVELGLLLAQQRKAAEGQKQAAVSVPYVGCRSDGQTGPLDAPAGEAPKISIRADIAQRIAYYSSAEGIGVLAPRSWYCAGTYGSGGEHLYVSPQPISARSILSLDWGGLTGPGIQRDHRYGGTSGRFAVAEIIARVFPSFNAFAMRVNKELEPPDAISFGPYPMDALAYRGKTVVEYRTPARATGLGTLSSLRENESPIVGVVILVEKTPDVIQLSVRIPSNLRELTPIILRQVEREASRRPQPNTIP
jgi:hypothetical protein